MRPQVIFSGTHLRATMIGAAHDRVVFTFDHWRRDRNGLEREHGATFLRRGYAHVQITTARNDWYLNRDLPGLLTRIAEATAPFRERIGLGFSMGGYGLFAASRAVDFDRLMFVSPHTTFAPDLPHGAAIGDTRFMPDPMDGIFAREAHRVLRATGKAPGDAVVLFDPSLPEDQAHANEISLGFQTVRQVRLPGAGHPVTQGLPSHRVYKLLVDALMQRPIRTEALQMAYDRHRRVQNRAMS
ncbi:MAG TPA: hypothetical protein DEO85_10170 [Maritimibacter sp.]|nr:hypothetical protein [Maritimibacter sp.]